MTPLGQFQKIERIVKNDYVTKRDYNDKIFDIEDIMKRETQRIDDNYYIKDEIETKLMEL